MRCWRVRRQMRRDAAYMRALRAVSACCYAAMTLIPCRLRCLYRYADYNDIHMPLLYAARCCGAPPLFAPFQLRLLMLAATMPARHDACSLRHATIFAMIDACAAHA